MKKINNNQIPITSFVCALTILFAGMTKNYTNHDGGGGQISNIAKFVDKLKRAGTKKDGRLYKMEEQEISFFYVTFPSRMSKKIIFPIEPEEISTSIYGNFMKCLQEKEAAILNIKGKYNQGDSCLHTDTHMTTDSNFFCNKKHCRNIRKEFWYTVWNERYSILIFKAGGSYEKDK